MQIKTPSHRLPLWCEYEWTGVNRDAWDYLPARSVQNNGCWAGFQSIWGTQSSACWGYNGPIKAPCFPGEKTLLHGINQYNLLRSRKVSPFSHPARRLRLEGIVVDADLWPAHGMLMQQRNVEMREPECVCVCWPSPRGSISRIWKCFGLWCKCVSRRSRRMQPAGDSCHSLCCFLRPR